MSQAVGQNRNLLMVPSQPCSFFVEVKILFGIKLGINLFQPLSFLLSSPSSFCPIFPAEKKITTQLEGESPAEAAEV